MATQAPAETYAPAQTYAPPPQATTGQAAPVDDISDWINRVKAVIEKPETVTAPAPASAVPWHERFVAFFDPVELCCVTWCCPCVTFGKTHHRLRKDPSLKDYSAVNPSCLAFWVSTMFCGHLCLQTLQRHDVRTKYHLQGDCAMDLLRACCCPCCDLIQQEKEAAYHALSNVEMEQPAVQADMKMPLAPQP